MIVYLSIYLSNFVHKIQVLLKEVGLEIQIDFVFSIFLIDFIYYFLIILFIILPAHLDPQFHRANVSNYWWW